MHEQKISVEAFNDYKPVSELASYCTANFHKRMMVSTGLISKNVTFYVTASDHESKVFDTLEEALDYYNSI